MYPKEVERGYEISVVGYAHRVPPAYLNLDKRWGPKHRGWAIIGIIHRFHFA